MKEALIALERYFELVQEPYSDGTIMDNPEWDRGFQSAMAVIRGKLKTPSDETQSAFEDGQNYGWNEAVEILRLLRYTAEEEADPIGVEYYTKAIKKLGEGK